ncbi:MAG: hypothetical protein Q4C47_09225 [Planctomycetia bacterium]|nr:hypothetical protein [Planctomycetia bacterium]
MSPSDGELRNFLRDLVAESTQPTESSVPAAHSLFSTSPATSPAKFVSASQGHPTDLAKESFQNFLRDLVAESVKSQDESGHSASPSPLDVELSLPRTPSEHSFLRSRSIPATDPDTENSRLAKKVNVLLNAANVDSTVASSRPRRPVESLTEISGPPRIGVPVADATPLDREIWAPGEGELRKIVLQKGESVGDVPTTGAFGKIGKNHETEEARTEKIPGKEGIERSPEEGSVEETGEIEEIGEGWEEYTEREEAGDEEESSGGDRGASDRSVTRWLWFRDWFFRSGYWYTTSFLIHFIGLTIFAVVALFVPENLF